MPTNFYQFISIQKQIFIKKIGGNLKTKKYKSSKKFLKKFMQKVRTTRLTSVSINVGC